MDVNTQRKMRIELLADPVNKVSEMQEFMFNADNQEEK